MADDQLSLQEKLTRCEAYRRSMMNATRDYTRIFHDAQDAVQEALIRVAKRDDIDWDRVEGLLITSTRNICIDMFRSVVRREWRDQSYTYSAISALQDVDPYEAVLDRAEAQHVARLVADLIDPTTQRILQRLGDGHALTVIAADERLKYKTAHSLVMRARRRVVSALNEAM